MPVRVIQLDQLVKSALRIRRAFLLAKYLVRSGHGIRGGAVGPRGPVVTSVPATIVGNGVRTTLLGGDWVFGRNSLVLMKMRLPLTCAQKCWLLEHGGE